MTNHASAQIYMETQYLVEKKTYFPTVFYLMVITILAWTELECIDCPISGACKQYE